MFLSHVDSLQKLLLGVYLQVLALPLGVALARVCHCVPDRTGASNVMYADNSNLCLSDIQWSYIAAAIGVSLFSYLIFPVWLIRKTRTELIFSHSAGKQLERYHILLTYPENTRFSVHQLPCVF